MKEYKVITPEEESKILGMTQEEIEQRVEEYETDNWHFEPGSKLITCSPQVYFNTPKSERSRYEITLKE